MQSLLTSLGWDTSRAHELDALGRAELVPARVTGVDRGAVELLAAEGPLAARVAGSVVHREDPPTVGDWVALDPAALRVDARLERRSVIRRGREGMTPQTLAANVDLALVLTPPGRDFNIRRLHRYAALAEAGGVRPVVVISKADLAEDLAGRLAEVRIGLPGTDTFTVSAATGEGLAELRARLGPGVTAVMLGSSGAGKSTLVNALLGDERLATGAVRDDDERGRHTTARRQLLVLSDGGLVIDTPGLRAPGLVGDEPQAAGFGDVAELAGACRFRDCRHEDEPGCAVIAAVASGRLPAERLASHRALEHERAALALRLDEAARRRAGRHAQRAYRQVRGRRER